MNAFENVMRSNVNQIRATEDKYAWKTAKATSVVVRKERIWSKENAAMRISPGYISKISFY